MPARDSGSFESGYATAEDVPEIVAVLTEASARMAAKHNPLWQASVLTEAFVTPRVERAEFIVARRGGEIAGVCTLTRSDPEFWPEDPVGQAAYLHKLGIRRRFAGGGVTARLVEHCLGLARVWGCAALRLDCHPTLRGLYERLGFSYVDTREVREDDGQTITVDRLQVWL
jgi:GNAT superfamily N-acetyltransferase